MPAGGQLPGAPLLILSPPEPLSPAPDPTLHAVYIGDSMTDLPPLLSADAGILIGQNDLVRRVTAVAGARCAAC